MNWDVTSHLTGNDDELTKRQAAGFVEFYNNQSAEGSANENKRNRKTIKTPMTDEHGSLMTANSMFVSRDPEVGPISIITAPPHVEIVGR